jgi:hypothetical protein
MNGEIVRHAQRSLNGAREVVHEPGRFRVFGFLHAMKAGNKEDAKVVVARP